MTLNSHECLNMGCEHQILKAEKGQVSVSQLNNAIFSKIASKGKFGSAKIIPLIFFLHK